MQECENIRSSRIEFTKINVQESEKNFRHFLDEWFGSTWYSRDFKNSNDVSRRVEYDHEFENSFTNSEYYYIVQRLESEHIRHNFLWVDSRIQ